MRYVLLIDDELAKPDQSRLFQERYAAPGFSFLFARDANEALEQLASHPDVSLILLDIVFENVRSREAIEVLRQISAEIWPSATEHLSGNEHGLAFLLTLRKEFAHIPVVMLSSKTVPGILLWCWRTGACYYMVKPVETAAVLQRVLDEFARWVSREMLQGVSEAIRHVRERIRLAAEAGSAISVLITGESGTGKELVARSIYQSGPRRESPFVVVNCSAIPEALIESELFGHKKGSFTGAVADHKGKLAMADGGVLFLDEIGELSADIQSKLLRALDRGMRFSPIGVSTEVSADVQLVAATNRDLREAVKEGRFRQDLWYRLNVFPIEVPPLRDRRQDIPILAEHFLQFFRSTRYRGRRRANHFSAEAQRLMQAHQWPGNVRELENAVEFALVQCEGEVIEAAHLPLDVTRGHQVDAAQYDDFVFPLNLSVVTARTKWAAIRGAVDEVGESPRFGLIDRVCSLIGLSNPSDLQRTVLPGIIEACPDLEVEIRQRFPERRRASTKTIEKRGES